MCDDLRSLGVNDLKAHTMRMPNIPKKYIRNFIRGYFDGDGHVWSGLIHKDRKNSKITLQTGLTSCSELFLRDLQNRLQKLGLGKGSLYAQRNYFRLNYSLKNSLIL